MHLHLYLYLCLYRHRHRHQLNLSSLAALAALALALLPTTNSQASMSTPGSNPPLPFIVATRLHLGKQSTPPPQSKLELTVSTFLQTATSIGASKAVIAIDSNNDKIPGYNLFQSVQDALNHVMMNNNSTSTSTCTAQTLIPCHLLPVSPWGMFVPALNALTSYACTTELQLESSSSSSSEDQNQKAQLILFLSAETTLNKQSYMELSQHMNLDDTLVVGAALSGHEYSNGNNGDDNGNGRNEKVVELNGRTCPWNTLALWNLNKLILGFPLLADGVHTLSDGSPIAAGIEEFSTVLIHQKIMGDGKAKAKLIKVSGVEWEQSFDGDEERRKWHETKMKSKTTRAETHRRLLGGGKGFAIHL
jgi:hypothetical protein